nr:putative ribonuclease H-like domain-containing protein [Tanacetum cinerariifolium]
MLHQFKRESDRGTQDPLFSSSSKDSPGDGFKPSGKEEKKDVEDPGNKDNEVLSTEDPRVNLEKDVNVNSTNNINTVSPTTNVASTKDNVIDENIVYGYTNIPVSPIPTTRIYKDHLVEQIIRDIHSAPQTRRMTKSVTDHELSVFLFSITSRTQEGNPSIDRSKNKKDERGIVVRNKPRLVAQGYTQEEGIYYNEVFAPVARIKTIRLFLAYASFKDFVVYQMDVKSAFLYGEIEEEVYVCQPTGFEDPKFPDKVYKVEKALYGLHQAPRALKTSSTPMETSKPLMKDENAKDIDVHLYRSMIESLMYLTSSRPDIMFVRNQVFNVPKVCASFLDKQVDGMSKHNAIYVIPSHTKKVFSNIKRVGKDFSGRDTPLFPTMIVKAQEELGKDIDTPTNTQHTPTIIQPTTSQPQRKQKPRKIRRKDTELPQTSVPTEVIADEAVYKEMYDSLERAATTATSLDAEQDRGIISKT